MKKSELIKIIREAIKEAETVGLGKDKSGCPKNFQCKKNSDCAKFNDKECGHHECQGGCCMRGCDYPKKGKGSDKKNIKEQAAVSTYLNAGYPGNLQGPYPGNFNGNTWGSSWPGSNQANFVNNPTGRCNFVVQRINNWASQIYSVGPLFQNQLNYKLSLAHKVYDGTKCCPVHNVCL